jgi:lipopolysaccharide export system protein LptA
LNLHRVLPLLALVFLAAISAPDREPLIMENADHMEGFRARGEYILSGHVRFRHGELRFETERAVWQRDQNRVFCETGIRITHRGSLLTADHGSYDKNGNQAQAEGNVFMRDSSGEVEATGGRLTYDRVRREAVLTGNPVARRIYPDTTKSTDTVRSKGPDTLSIRGETLRYRDSSGIAEARGNVVITRRDLRITCGRAEYRKQADSMFLWESPVVKVDESEVKGIMMRLGLHGEELRGMMVTGQAEALSLEKATDSTRAHKSRVEGDSLFVAFRQGSVDSVQVFRRATGTYFDVDRPQYVNRMSGDYMVLRFQEKRVHDAEVLGTAKSTYYHFEKDSLKGKNRAEGDTIALAFRQGKIDEVLVKGLARGVYEGRNLGRSTKKPGTKQEGNQKP